MHPRENRSDWLDAFTLDYCERRYHGERIDLSPFDLSPEEQTTLEQAYQGYLWAKIGFRLLRQSRPRRAH